MLSPDSGDVRRLGHVLLSRLRMLANSACFEKGQGRQDAAVERTVGW